MKYKARAGLMALLIGAALMAPVFIGLNIWSSPKKNASQSTWEAFERAKDNGSVTALWVFEDSFEYQTENSQGEWLSVTKQDPYAENRVLWNTGIAKYPDEEFPKALGMAAVVLLAVGPLVAMSAAKNPEKKGSKQQPATETTAPRPAQTKPQEPPVQTQKPSEDPELEERPLDAVSSTDIKVNKVTDTRITFADIAGYEVTKRNMEFIVQCLTRPELLKQVGAKIPAGVLFYGPPGTGKTLMARAVAGSAGVAFYSANASEFVNTWVGKGASNVRALYQEAKANAPSVVFIDEIDAVGGKRNDMSNDERRQTLNALLSEMDGLSKDSGVLTIAATNAYESLDPALVRPGRFDRKVLIPLPNYNDRLAILRLYAKNRNMERDISMEDLARDTNGLAGAGLATMFNEAAIRAVMAGRGVITRKDIDGALEQILTDAEESRLQNQADRRIVAYHEAGHAIILRLLAGETIPKVTILGSTAGLLGNTLYANESGRMTDSIQHLRRRIVALYGGRAAEELVFGKDEVTTSSSQDLRMASAWLNDYLRSGAGSSLLDVEAFSGMDSPGARVAEAQDLAAQLYAEAMDFLAANRDKLDALANALLERETLFQMDVEAIIG